MNIKSVYGKFGVTPNLEKHMLTVAQVILFIKEHWRGPEIDWEALKKSALLHDVGNIVKFDLEKYPHLLGDKKYKIGYWKQIQKETIEKYGRDDNEATKKMLYEVGINKKIIEIVFNKAFGNVVQIAASQDWYVKILLYADLRVLPDGVATMEERFEDIRERMPKYTNRIDFEDLLEAAKEIENQIQEKLNIPVSEINNKSIGRGDDEFLRVNI